MKARLARGGYIGAVALYVISWRRCLSALEFVIIDLPRVRRSRCRVLVLLMSLIGENISAVSTFVQHLESFSVSLKNIVY
jgi:hypothetical protein